MRKFVWNKLQRQRGLTYRPCAEPGDGNARVNRRRFLGQGALLPAALCLAYEDEAVSAQKVSEPPCAGSGVGAAQEGPSPILLPIQAKASEGFASLGNVTLWYWDTGGTGVPVVLLHPFTGSARVWPYQQPALARAGFRVIGYSRRGFEGSDTGSKQDLGTAAEDLQALVEHLAIGRFHAVATAGGAFVAVDYALSHPERVLSLTLACSILGIQDQDSFGSSLHTPGFEQMPAYFRELGPSYRAVNPQGTQAWRDLESTSMPHGRVTQPYQHRLTLDVLADLSMPTLLICGDADLIAPPPVMRQLASRIRGSELQIIAECGHSAYWERPDLFNGHVLDFLRRQRPSGA